MNAPPPDLLFTHMGAFRARKDAAGRIETLLPFEQDRDPSDIGRSIAGALVDPLRIAQPMVREGFLREGAASRERRGRENFVAVSWERANALVATHLKRVIAAHGNEAIFGGSYGWASAGRVHHAQSVLHRFLNCVGGYVRSVNTHSYAAAEVLLPHIIGGREGLDSRHTPWSDIAANTRLAVMFGGMPIKNAQVSAGGVARHVVRDELRRCRAAGVEFVNISPLRSDAEDFLAAQWIAIRPNTDVALMLALAHTLLSEGLHDEAFLARYCVGFDAFAVYLRGAGDGVAKSADWAAPITGVDAQAIRALARRMAATRTLVTVSWSLQRADHGEQPLWAAITLAAMLGQIGLPGGGFGFGYGGSNRIGQSARDFAWPALPQGVNPVRAFIPVARLADMLLNPGAEFDYDGRRRTYPDIRLVWWAGGNPFHAQQDLNKLVAAWRGPEVVIVQEPWWNALARHADIVLPVATSAERNDLGVSTAEAHMFAMKRLVEPFGESRGDYDILCGIAEAMGVLPDFSEGRDEMDWVRHLYTIARQRAAEQDVELPEFEHFWRDGHFRLPEPAPTPPLFSEFRADPAARALATPSGRIEIHSERIAGFGYADCPAHPVWLEPAEWLGSARAQEFPLHLISNQPRTRLHSQYDNGAASLASKIAGREPVEMHPDDAAARGLCDGDVARVYNDRGQCLAGVRLNDALARGVVALATGAWFDPAVPGEPGALERHGCVNVLTLDKGASRLSQAPVAHSALVEIERLATEPPPVGAFTPPAITKG